MATNLPPQIITDQAAGTKLFFDRYGEAPMEFASNDVTMTHAFFENKGFDHDAASVVSMTILRQAKIDGTPIAQILDTLKGASAIVLSQLVGEILNNNRISTSLLGFRATDVITNRSRNIAA